jgi:hypothetical protein
MTLTVVEVSSSITDPPAESILGQMTSNPEVRPRNNFQRGGPEVGFEEMCLDGPTPLTDISLKSVSG